MLYEGDKVVNAATCSPEGGPAEAGGLSASSLPGIDCLSMLQLTHPKVALRKPEAVNNPLHSKHAVFLINAQLSLNPK